MGVYTLIKFFMWNDIYDVLGLASSLQYMW